MEEILRSTWKNIEKLLREALQKREQILDRLKEAREHGDLSENFDYHQAREEQYVNEEEIKRLKQIYENALPIDLKYFHCKINNIFFTLILGGPIDVKYGLKNIKEDKDLINPMIISQESPAGLILTEIDKAYVVKALQTPNVKSIKLRNGKTIRIDEENRNKLYYIVNNKEVSMELWEQPHPQ